MTLFTGRSSIHFTKLSTLDHGWLATYLGSAVVRADLRQGELRQARSRSDLPLPPGVKHNCLPTEPNYSN